jgi:uncharacterized repeat protein (TIGR03943 family)
MVVNRLTQSIVTVLLGGLLLAITASGRFTSYVKPGFAPLLLIGGGALVLVGVISLVLAVRADLRAERAVSAGPHHADQADDDHDHDHDHGVGPDAHGHDHDSSRAPWLIVVPVLVLLLVAPPALGADSITRTAQSQAVAGYELVGAGSESGSVADRQNLGGAAARAAGGDSPQGEGATTASTFPPLPEGTDPPLTMRDTVLRALYDPGASLADHPVTVTGFVAPAGDGFTGGWTIARMVISCCAADASPVQLHVDGDAPVATDTWVEAVVTAVPGTGGPDNFYVPTVQVHSLRSVPQPADPYEH